MVRTVCTYMCTYYGPYYCIPCVLAMAKPVLEYLSTATAQTASIMAMAIPGMENTNTLYGIAHVYHDTNFGTMVCTRVRTRVLL
jgi:hypothetical protein